MSFVAASSLGKCPYVPDALAHAAVQALDRVRRVHDLPHGRGESEERNDPVPVALPALDHGRETPSPLAAFECAQRLFGRRGIVGLVDRLQSLNQGLAVLPGRQADRIPDQVHDAGLHDRVREHGGDRVGKSLQPINDGEQNILHSAGLEVVHHAQPELGAFGLLDPQAEDVLVPGTPHADGQVYGLVAYQALVTDLDPQRIEVHDRVGRLQRPRLPRSNFVDDRIRHHRNEVRRIGLFADLSTTIRQ